MHNMYIFRLHSGTWTTTTIIVTKINMQTQFKWNAKQRFLIISTMSTSIEMTMTMLPLSNDQLKEMVILLANDINFFATAPSEKINTDERMQEKLKRVFALSAQFGPSEMYANLVKWETEPDSDEISFAG